MRPLLAVVLLSLAGCNMNPAYARNTGVIAADDPNRDWFKREKIHACCDYSDGKFVPFRLVEYGTGFQIKIEGEWVDVPPHAIEAVKGEKNPYLEALAWYREDSLEGASQKIWYIRCFIPGVGG